MELEQMIQLWTLVPCLPQKNLPGPAHLNPLATPLPLNGGKQTPPFLFNPTSFKFFTHSHKITTQTPHLALKNKTHRPDLQKLIGKGSGVERMRGRESQKSGRRYQRESSPAVTCPSTPAGTPDTHLHGPHQLFCWSRPKRARHFFGALRSDVTKKGRGSQRRGEMKSGKRAEREIN